eukprot:CAMPEP_0201606660 /NCGR_PEP_ID=MMETSP0492-20130828/6036_1 /ASSEMBLY_ACC=CAM_ASM_000837 /TAXON_ID=420259 /ORGANISM="Thalassiosira gravida, Strain GMp14c1" /LENGTH=100 /DNA_ID=CAMNT_0048071105 /DNA_START=302 /DNA_END=604 /DNA_ORIENTATION=+
MGVRALGVAAMGVRAFGVPATDVHAVGVAAVGVRAVGVAALVGDIPRRCLCRALSRLFAIMSRRVLAVPRLGERFLSLAAVAGGAEFSLPRPVGPLTSVS